MGRKKFAEVDWFDMREIPYRASRLLKALGNPKAYALVQLLLDEDVLSVEELADRLKRIPWAVSKMLRPLRDLDVVRYQRDGGGVLYTLKDRRRIEKLLACAEEYAKGAAEAHE